MTDLTKINDDVAASRALTLREWTRIGGGACAYCSVKTDSKHEFIKKEFNSSSDDFFKKELDFLLTFSGKKHFPKVMHCDREKRIVVMLNHGSLLTKSNCPKNYKDQLKTIASTLQSKNVYHNDIHSLNIVVNKSGVMTLIDFGWATRGEPGQWHMNLDEEMIAKSASIRQIFTSLFAKRKAEEFLDHPRPPEIHTLLVWNGTPGNVGPAETYIHNNLKQPAFTVLLKRRIPLEAARQKALCKSIYGGGNRVKGGAIFLCVVRDEKPVYKWARATACRQVLNVNMKRHKEALRKLLGGSVHAYHCAHGSYNTHEALQVLCPLKLDFVIKRPRFNSFGALFQCLNADPHLKYVVQRSFHEISNPPRWFLNGKDIDVLVSDYYHFKSITGARCVDAKFMRDIDNGFRIQNRILVAGVPVAFDVRFVGDDYVDSSWENDMLVRSTTMTIDKDCVIRVPSKVDEFYSLLYNILVQKPHPETSKHRIRLKKLIRKDVLPDVPSLWNMLRSYMSRNNYTFKRPVDRYVGFRLQ